MEKNHLIIIVAGIAGSIFLSTVIVAKAQEHVLLFENIFNGKKKILKTGDEVHLRFTVQDTMNAPFDVVVNDVTVFGTIESISGSTIELATKSKYFDRTSVTIPFSSIESFRKYSPLRPVTKAASVVAASAVGLLASIQISNSADVLSLENVGLAVGAGAAVLLNKQLFSDKMKFYMVEGWKPRLQMGHYKKH